MTSEVETTSEVSLLYVVVSPNPINEEIPEHDHDYSHTQCEGVTQPIGCYQANGQKSDPVK